MWESAAAGSLEWPCKLEGLRPGASSSWFWCNLKLKMPKGTAICKPPRPRICSSVNTGTKQAGITAVPLLPIWDAMDILKNTMGESQHAPKMITALREAFHFNGSPSVDWPRGILHQVHALLYIGGNYSALICFLQKENFGPHKSNMAQVWLNLFHVWALKMKKNFGLLYSSSCLGQTTMIF